MAKVFITLASLSGMLAVCFGAFGAHALKSRLDDYAMGVFRPPYSITSITASPCWRWALSPQPPADRAAAQQRLAVPVGIVIFSGSLYLLSFSGLRWLGRSRRWAAWRLSPAGAVSPLPVGKCWPDPATIALTDTDSRRPIRSYVLRTGRMTPGQQRALTRTGRIGGPGGTACMLDFDACFGAVGPRVEIGFGMGQSPGAMAAAAPPRNSWASGTSPRCRQTAARHGGAGRR